MKNPISYLLHIAIGSGVVADQWYGISEAGNIAVAAIWLIVLLTFEACVFVDKEDMKGANTTKIEKYILRLLVASNVIILFAAGWFVSGFALLVGWAATWIKRADMVDRGAETIK